jgi:hypothetical protein
MTYIIAGLVVIAMILWLDSLGENDDDPPDTIAYT